MRQSSHVGLLAAEATNQVLQYGLGGFDEGEIQVFIRLVGLGDVARSQHQGVTAQLLDIGSLGAVVDRLCAVACGLFGLGYEGESSAQA